MQLSGLELRLLKLDSGFQWFGERCHLMSSAKFNKLVDAYKWEEVFSAQSRSWQTLWTSTPILI